MKRTFKKLFNRDLSLFETQYWYRAEAHSLYKLTKNTARFNPLFVYTKGEGVGVYYGDKEVDKNFELLTSHFIGNPSYFKEITEKYICDCDKLQTSIQDYDVTRGVGLLFTEISENIFPVVSIIMTIGNIKGDSLKDESAYALSLRKDTEKILYDAGEKLYDLIIKKYPEHKEYVDYLTIEEILEDKLPTDSEIEERASGYIYFEDKVYSGLDMRELERQLEISIVQNTMDNTNEIVGSVAREGKVKGIARVMFTIRDISKIRKGDIIVTAMTTPDFLPAMKKASAFVTDEGGITCHAAIVAREMVKPCIIGTKIATQVLKDGDLVEVDANNGVVKVLKRSSC